MQKCVEEGGPKVFGGESVWLREIAVETTSAGTNGDCGADECEAGVREAEGDVSEKEVLKRDFGGEW